MTLLIPALGLAFSVPAPAVQDVPAMEYTYVEANYIWTDIDDADEEVDGIELIGSLELPMNFFAQLGVARQETGNVDFDTFRLGAGYHLPVGPRLDAYGILSFVRAEVDVPGNDFDEDGPGLEAGLRYLLRDDIEVNGAARWVDLEDEDFGIGAGARYYFSEMLSVGGRVETLDDDLTIALGARFEL